MEPHEDETCGHCDYPIVVREGRHGRFVGCSRFPACSWSRSIEEERPRRPASRPSGAGLALSSSSWHYLYCDQILDVSGGPAGWKFGHSNHPLRRVQEHRDRFSECKVRMAAVLRGLKAHVLQWESLLKSHTLAQGWNMNASGEWIGPRPEVFDMFEACAGRRAVWSPTPRPPSLHVEIESAEWVSAKQAHMRGRKAEMIVRGDQSVVSVDDLKAMIRLVEEERARGGAPNPERQGA